MNCSSEASDETSWSSSSAQIFAGGTKWLATTQSVVTSYGGGTAGPGLIVVKFCLLNIKN